MKISNAEILKLTRKVLPSQIKWRRHFHQYPELSNQEFRTTEFIRQQLKGRRIKLIPTGMKTGLAAIIKGSGAACIALRSDIDALPVTEINDISYKSKNNGIMHACGHDVHMAVVLGTAILVNEIKGNLGGSVKFIFQPAEELPPGGADRMLKAGVFKNPKVDMVVGLHTDPTLPTGKIGLRDGATMAAVVDFDIEVTGRGGHAAAPHKGVDAIATAAEIVGSMQKVVSRETNPMEPALITFGKISGGTARNVLADKAYLHGTARTLSARTLNQLPRLIRRTAQGICRARGARCRIEFLANYPVLENHPSANKLLAQCYTDIFGRGKIETTKQIMGGEDFAFYLKKATGAMFRLGVRNPKIGAVKPWHSPDFMVDEDAIYYGTSLMVKTILEFLRKERR